jgi:hypothetical protein
MVTNDEGAAGGSAAQGAEPHPLWTLRFTWSVLGSEDRPTYTYVVTGSESEAIDRAVFAFDRNEDGGERLLVAAHVKREDGWSEVPRSSSRLAQHGYLFAFQRPPGRPS